MQLTDWSDSDLTTSAMSPCNTVLVGDSLLFLIYKTFINSLTMYPRMAWLALLLIFPFSSN